VALYIPAWQALLAPQTGHFCNKTCQIATATCRVSLQQGWLQHCPAIFTRQSFDSWGIFHPMDFSNCEQPVMRNFTCLADVRVAWPLMAASPYSLY